MASYCAGCGTSLLTGARFCSICGKSVVEPGPIAGAPRPPLIRPIAGKKLAGVCIGLSNQHGWDVTLVRVIFVLLAIATFPIGLVAYLLLWWLAPQEQPVRTPVTSLDTAT